MLLRTLFIALMAGLFVRAVLGSVVAAAPVAVMQLADATTETQINDGAKIVQGHGCAACHGANLKGGAVGPSLYGIEHKLTADEIAALINNPGPPMPNFGLSQDEIGSIVAYLSNLDGGVNNQVPVVTLDPATPVDVATIKVRFSGAPPAFVTVLPIMQMGTATMQTRQEQLQQSSSDSHLFTGRIVFSMGGAWTLRIEYGGNTLNVPVNVGE